MKNNYAIPLFVAILLTWYAGNVKGQAYANLPYVEHFDNMWINGTGTRDLPSIHWQSTPVTGYNSWSRNDDGVARGAWSYDDYLYSPAGARGTANSARFGSGNADQGTIGTLDLYVDFSNPAGNKILNYYFINEDGSDSLEVFLSTNGGTSFTKIDAQKTKSSWSLIAVSLGAPSTANGVIRFKATADYGASDIGLDEVMVYEVSNPPVLAKFSTNTISGNAPLPVTFTDLSTGNPTSWKWDFNNDGLTESTSQNPDYIFDTPGIYNVKLVTFGTGSSDSIVKIGCIKVNAYASLPFYENFEKNWIDAGDLRNIPSQYWTNTPVTGNNSWSRNDDGVNRGAWSGSNGFSSPYGANGTSYSARIHTYSTSNSGTLDLNVNFSTATDDKTLIFWYNNADGEDSLKVFLSTDGGTNFGAALEILTTVTGWQKITVNLGNITTATGVIRFTAIGDEGYSDIAIDEIRVSTVFAEFTSDVTSGIAPLTVHFTDNSSGTPTSWKWDFNNDGVFESTEQNPSYTYNSGGRFTVKLVVAKSGISDTIVKTNYIKVSAYASLPFSENFENPWINSGGVRDVPSQYWANTPSTGNNSWSRDDDGVNRGAWTGSSGFSSPYGAHGTSHSARIHTYSTSHSGTLDLNINFSAVTDDKTLIFWYNNADGEDSLKVFLSTDGGTNFGTALEVLTTVTGWQQITVNLGNITTATGVIRFTAIGDYGYSDIAIDEIKVSTVFSEFTSDVTSGTTPLTVHFTDNSTGTPTSWKWDFNNDGVFESTEQNPSYTYNSMGIFTVKLVVAKSGISDTIIKTNYVKVTDYAPLPFSENFESTWIDKQGVRDVPSLYWINTATDDNSIWSRDDDGSTWNTQSGSYSPTGASGTSHSARFHSYDSDYGTGILDVNINFSNAPTKDTLRFYYINMGGEDSLEVSLSTNGGTSFTKINSQKTETSWTLVKISLGNVNTATGVIRFKAISDYGYSDIGIDQVNVTGASNQTDFKTYSLPGQTGITTIDAGTHAIAVTMPYGSSVSSLEATFTLSTGATAKVGAAAQVSGSTANNFTTPLTYLVTAEDGTTQNWTVTVTIAKNNQADIIAFSLPGQTGNATINSGIHTVAVTMPYGSSVSSLAATFALSAGATAKVGATDQVSGSTANNFITPLTYIVTAEDGTIQNWMVTVTVAQNNQAVITAFSLPGQTGNAVIDNSAQTINIDMPIGSSVSSLVATFTLSAGATAKIGAVAQTSGVTVNDFTSVVTYTITAQDGTTQTWTVTVNVPNGQTDITAFSLPGQTGNAIINNNAHTIGINVPNGTQVSALAATFTLSSGATAKVGTISQVSGSTTNDFTSAVTYIITGQNGGSTQNWTVTVTVAPNNQAGITAFNLPWQLGNTIINAGSHTIVVSLPGGTSLTSLVATFMLSPGATAKIDATSQISGNTINDFTVAKTYVVTAQDGITTQNWTVSVAIIKNRKTVITAFSVPGQSGVSIIDTINHTVMVKVPAGTDITAIVASFTLSAGATAKIDFKTQVSGATVNDFTIGKIYRIIAQDTTCAQTWLVIVSKLVGIADVLSDQGIIAYPNPSSGLFRVKVNFSDPAQLAVYNLEGARIAEKTVEVNSDGCIFVDLTQNPSGIYFLRINTKNKVYQVKVVIQGK